ncbi:uncharacterized protein LOC114753892 [Neltuma alba]|uniref:uncharacterized protein LOC114753705 n=1 Tax=Neltuma alba TaxID=207710 RepID=UPI0010A4F7AC|nr:uncharacterized protein LOC114753705 [Prosopis alba]XP_028798245.1 uncharacterized protein LOC114753705 [Prosopis alba]XP_028798429.1 uncharacterized protein LOC114753892 [Prosopis alba]XP_028798431.1 uncharacterized protein LOC114753892 [Prosopis alba]
MAASSSRTRSSGPVLRSLSPSGRFCSYSTSNIPFSSPSYAFASSSGSSFSSPCSTFFTEPQHHHHHTHHRSASPTQVNLYSSTPPSSAVKFSIDRRSVSPNRSISNHVIGRKNHPISFQKKTCMCAPTSHPGSFRCSLHRNMPNHNSSNHAYSYPSNRLNMRRSAMKNSLVRIGGVEGEWVKRALTALIRPSSHQLRRRAAFEPRPSRLSIMSKAEDI